MNSSPRKFYKTTYVYEVLHEREIPETWDLGQVMAEAEHGGFSGDVKSVTTEEVGGLVMAKLLEAQRSDPDFFNLTSEGDDVDEDS